MSVDAVIIIAAGFIAFALYEISKEQHRTRDTEDRLLEVARELAEQRERARKLIRERLAVKHAERRERIDRIRVAVFREAEAACIERFGGSPLQAGDAEMALIIRHSRRPWATAQPTK